jgi:hypothetical protein
MAKPSNNTLMTVPVEIAGSWGRSLPQSARQVVLWMRAACLTGVRLRSDRQPADLRVEDHSSGPPAIWLHADPPRTAWIIVDIGERDWSKLAYQFGHELGHVLCNSWRADAQPQTPCQWVEESLVEAFSIRGLARLADDWQREPPFPGDNAFSSAIRNYRSVTLGSYQAAGGEPGKLDLAEWFKANRGEAEKPGGLRVLLGPAIVAWVKEYEQDPGCVEDLGALNRWPERSGLPIADYLAKWRSSCQELKLSGRLPARVKDLLGVA